jgi:hypothetical protein
MLSVCLHVITRIKTKSWYKFAVANKFLSLVQVKRRMGKSWERICNCSVAVTITTIINVIRMYHWKFNAEPTIACTTFRSCIKFCQVFYTYVLVTHSWIKLVEWCYERYRYCVCERIIWTDKCVTHPLIHCYFIMIVQVYNKLLHNCFTFLQNDDCQVWVKTKLNVRK